MAITVVIYINKDPIIVTSAQNKIEQNEHGETKYITQDEHIIWHNREKRAIPLAIKMLELELKCKYDDLTEKILTDI